MPGRYLITGWIESHDNRKNSSHFLGYWRGQIPLFLQQSTSLLHCDSFSMMAPCFKSLGRYRSCAPPLRLRSSQRHGTFPDSREHAGGTR